MARHSLSRPNSVTLPRHVLWNGHEIAHAVGGQWRGVGTRSNVSISSASRGANNDWNVTGLSIDSRSLVEGDLFIPLSDARDGHEFIPVAFEKGAGAVLSSRDINDVPAVLVDDPQTALRQLAHAARDRSSAQRVGVTGSVGKTSVKDMIAHICAAQSGRVTHKSQRSFNNHWGVPLTMASMARDTDYGIFEMGMNHKGELSDLTQIVRPHIALVTKIAAAHLEHFSGVEQIAHAKAEIFEGLVSGGTAIIPHEGEYSEVLIAAAQSTSTSIKTFGAQKADALPQADMVYSNVDLGARSCAFDLSQDGQTQRVFLPMAGMHAVENASAAILCAVCLGIPITDAVTALASLEASSGRGAIYDLLDGGHEFTLIDESYNANPKSMRAGLAAFALHAGRKMLVLGDMHELGPDEMALHAGLASDIVALEPDFVLCCGDRMGALYHVLTGQRIATTRSGTIPQYFHCDTAAAGLDLVMAHLGSVDQVMIKGSNASGMGKISAKLLSLPRQADPVSTPSSFPASTLLDQNDTSLSSIPSSTLHKDEMNAL